MSSLYSIIEDFQKKAIPCVLVTVVKVKGNAPRHVGSKMLVTALGKTYDTIGGGAIEKKAIDDALDLLKKRQCKTIEYDISESNKDDLNMICGGKVELYYDIIVSPKRLVIFGAGHIALPLAQLGKLLNYKVVVIDNRKEFANIERFTDIDQIICDEYENTLKDFDFSSDDHIVIITHGHSHDEEVLRGCINKPYSYLGMIGSKKKVKIILEKLREEGVSSEIVNNIHTPIGLDIGAETPEEIAIAIISEIIAISNKKELPSCKISL